MPIASKDDLIDLAVTLMGGTADDLSSAVKELTADQAVSETCWIFPVGDGIKSYWLIERTRRHMLQVLANVAALKFQYKQIHLEHRFKHLNQLISKMDEDFATFVEDNPELFLDAFASLGDLDNFITYISNGFEYSPTGIEL